MVFSEGPTVREESSLLLFFVTDSENFAAKLSQRAERVKTKPQRLRSGAAGVGSNLLQYDDRRQRYNYVMKSTATTETEDWLRNPQPGSAAAAARDFGIDLTLVISQLRLTPEERIRRLDSFRAAVRELRESMKHQNERG